ncbi:MAG: hypothetical protein H0W72_16720 [Planctomycetes bacterium]|nr:hypothetical protein [Planctomycetota bacterium]
MTTTDDADREERDALHAIVRRFGVMMPASITDAVLSAGFRRAPSASTPPEVDCRPGTIMLHTPTPPEAGESIDAVEDHYLDAIKRIEAQRDAALADAAALRVTVDWLAQTVHRAHHDGALDTCEKTTCRAARDAAAAPAAKEGTP